MGTLTPEIVAWKEKLSSWEGQFDAKHPYIDVAAKALADSLRTADRDTQVECAHLFAKAFKISYPDAFRTIFGEMAYELQHGNNNKTVDEHVSPTLALPALPLKLKLLRDIVKWAAPLETPAQYVLFSFLTAASAGIGRVMHLTIGPYVIYPNIYTILVGPSGARKDSAIDLAIEVFRQAGVDLRILPDEGSIHGILKGLAVRSPDDGRGFFVVPELRVLLGSRGDKTKETGGVWLTHLFKAPKVFDRETAKYEVHLKNTYLTMLGGTTNDWFVEMPESIMSAGFLARVLLVSAFGKKGYFWDPAIDTTRTKDILDAIADAYKEVPHGKLDQDKETREFLADWYENTLPKWTQEIHPFVAPFLERAHVHVMKLAMVLHVLTDGGGCLKLPVVKQAIDLVKWATLSHELQVDNLSSQPQSRIYTDITTALRNKGNSLNLRRLTRILRNKYKAAEVREAIEALAYQGDVEIVARGREIECILRRKE